MFPSVLSYHICTVYLTVYHWSTPAYSCSVHSHKIILPCIIILVYWHLPLGIPLWICWFPQSTRSTVRNNGSKSPFFSQYTVPLSNREIHLLVHYSEYESFGLLPMFCFLETWTVTLQSLDISICLVMHYDYSTFPGENLIWPTVYLSLSQQLISTQ